MQFKIRAFRAPTDLAACEKFIAGHKHVLETVGVKQVTSLNDKWKHHHGTFVIIVESMDGEIVYGGARLQAVDGIVPLPIESATGDMDSNIYKMVAETAQRGTGEICGSWNSRRASGFGVGAFFANRVGITISSQLGLTSVWALCAPYTLRYAERIGCSVVGELGINGTFYYPKIDLLATAVLMRDSVNMPDALPFEIERVAQLRKNLNQDAIEDVPEHPGRQVDLAYRLEIQDINPDEFKIIASI
jgi:hypothetical protein